MKRNTYFSSVLSVLLCLVLVLSLASCGANPEKVVTAKVTELCKAMQAGDYVKIAELTGADSSDSADALGEDSLEALGDFMKEISKDMKYQLGEVTVDGDSASVAVHFTYRDASEEVATGMYNYLLKALELAFTALSEGSADPTDDEMAALLADCLNEALEGAETKLTEKDVAIPLEKDKQGSWNFAELSTDLADVMTGNAITAIANFSAGL